MDKQRGKIVFTPMGRSIWEQREIKRLETAFNIKSLQGVQKGFDYAQSKGYGTLGTIVCSLAGGVAYSAGTYAKGRRLLQEHNQREILRLLRN